MAYDGLRYPIEPTPASFVSNSMYYNSVNFDIEFDSSLYSFYNRTYKLNIGYSLNTMRENTFMQAYSDTSEHQFSKFESSPLISFSEDFVLDNLFSFSYTLGYQQNRTRYDYVEYKADLMMVSINPQLRVFYKYGIEYYVKLKLGYAYRNINEDILPDQIARLLPPKHQVFTGVTLAGINVFASPHWGANVELSLWSPETVNFGLTYRFLKTPN